MACSMRGYRSTLTAWTSMSAAFGTNLTGTHYYDQAANLEDLTGGDYGYAAAPRLYGIEFIKKFGG